MDHFDLLLNEAIDSSLTEKNESVDNVGDLLDEIKVAEENLAALAGQLDGRVEELCAAVSAELKSLLPKVDAKLSKGGIIFSYYTRSIGIKPDLDNRNWQVEPSENGPRERAMGRKFKEKWNSTPLGDWKELVQALAQLLVTNFKTLQGGNVDLPEPKEEEPKEDGISDESIDNAIDNVGASSPQAPGGPPIERKGGSKSPGSTYYA